MIFKAARPIYRLRERERETHFKRKKGRHKQIQKYKEREIREKYGSKLGRETTDRHKDGQTDRPADRKTVKQTD